MTLYDRRGIPIREGDLIRTPHYRHPLRKQQMWLYHVVERVEGTWLLFAWRNPRRHTCLATPEIIDWCEIIAESGIHRREDGTVETWNERPRKKKGGAK